MNFKFMTIIVQLLTLIIPYFIFSLCLLIKKLVPMQSEIILIISFGEGRLEIFALRLSIMDAGRNQMELIISILS